MMCLVFISLLKRLPERDGIYFPCLNLLVRVSIDVAQEPLSRLCSTGITNRNRKLDLNIHCLRRPIVRFVPCQTWVSLSPRRWRMFRHRNGWEDEGGVLRTRPRSQCHWIEAIMASESCCLAGILLVVPPTLMFSGVSILLLPIGNPAYMQNQLRRIWRHEPAH